MTVSITGSELYGLYTPILLALVAVGGLLLEMTFWRGRPRAVGVFTLAGLGVTFLGQTALHLYRLNMYKDAVRPFMNQYYFDVYSVTFNFIFLVVAMVAVLISLSYFRDREDHRSEYYVLITLATIGMCMMAAANDLLIFFVGLETMSISIYVLVGFERSNDKSNEASIKYLLLGAFASAILLYGMALVYGITGEIAFDAIYKQAMDMVDPILASTRNYAISDEGPGMSVMGMIRSLGFMMGELPQPLIIQYLTLMIGMTMVLIGLFFKVAAVPFHMWAPDVYEGAPTPVTAYMATAVKAAAFAVLLRFAITSLTPFWGYSILYVVLYVLAVLTMTLGNFTAVAQKSIKRMLAYSSIAHAGYLLVGITTIIAAGQFLFIDPTAGQENTMTRIIPAASSILFYLVAYAFMNLGAFGVIAVVEREKRGANTLDGFSGLAARRPVLAAVMAIFMLSLAGVPPLAGFAAKFYLFQAAVYSRLYILAIIGVLNSVVSAYYYLRVIVVMYMHPEGEPFTERRRVTGAYLANVVMAAAVVVLGLIPGALITLLTNVVGAGMVRLPPIH